MKNMKNSILHSELLTRLKKCKGGYVYSGACSYQICFPLKDGTELRIATVDSDVLPEGETDPLQIEIYIPTGLMGVTGPCTTTGQ